MHYLGNSFGARSGGFGSEHSGNNLQVELVEEGQPDMQDRTDTKSAQHPTHHPTVRGVQGHRKEPCAGQHQEKPQVRSRRQRTLAVPLHHLNVRTGCTWLFLPLRLRTRLQRLHHHQARFPRRVRRRWRPREGEGRENHRQQRSGPRLCGVR